MKFLSNRLVNSKYDSIPAIHHHYILQISKPYIRSKRVLDLGCWTGQYSKLAIKYAGGVYGLDSNKAAINYAKKLTKKANFKTGSALKMPFKDKFFDTVVFSEVLEHLPIGTEKRAISEINRVLKPNGTLILTTPSNHIISIILDPAYFLIGHRHYSKSEVTAFLAFHNFTVKEVYYSKGIFNLLSSNIEAICKLFFNKMPVYPTLWKNKIRSELGKNGFSSIILIANKKTI